MLLYSKFAIQKVWDKGLMVSGRDSNFWRKDDCGALICRMDYGNFDSPYGWLIDRRNHEPIESGDEFIGLRPLQWLNKITKEGRSLVCPVEYVDGCNVFIYRYSEARKVLS